MEIHTSDQHVDFGKKKESDIVCDGLSVPW